MNYRIVYTRVAAADIPNLKAAHLAKKAQLLLGILADNPFQNPPPYEKLRGSLQGGLFSAIKYPASIGLSSFGRRACC